MKNGKSKQNWDFHGHTVLISAGAQGIGRGMVERFAHSGANVIFGDIDIESGKELENILSPAKGAVRFVEADFSQIDAWQPLLEVCIKNDWTPTVGIANAGIGARVPLTQISPEDYDRVTSINQRSSLLMAQHLTPYFRKRGSGSFIFIGSIVSEFGSKNECLYGMSKSALLGLCRSLAIELAPDGIRANCIQPGFILVDVPNEIRAIVPRKLWTACAEKFRGTFEKYLAICQPLAVSGTPDDIAQAACFLASSSAQFITGTSLRIDGGYSARFAPPDVAALFPPKFLSEISDWVKQQAE